MYKIKDEAVTSPLSKGNSSGHVNAVTKTLQILDCFTPEQPELSLAQISEKLNRPKSTLLNQIRTLEASGFLYRIPGSPSYRLGFKLMELNYCLYSSLTIVHYALPLMEDLQAATGEIIYLTTHINGQVLYLECVYPTRRSVSYSAAGKTLPMHCTGCGKAMLSYLPEQQVDQIIQTDGLPPKTSNTITDPDQLKADLAKARNLGYAIDVEEETLGVKCIAHAIRDGYGNVAGALSVSGSIMNMTNEKLKEYAKLLSNAANILSQYAYLFPAIQLQKPEK